jgi:DNA adenine methylase
MTVPQPFQYQGSKRALAPLILQYLPVSTTRLVEPFCGSAALSIATAARGRAKEFWLNDFNAPLAKLLSLIVNSPKELVSFFPETHGYRRGLLSSASPRLRFTAPGKTPSLPIKL